MYIRAKISYLFTATVTDLRDTTNTKSFRENSHTLFTAISIQLKQHTSTIIHLQLTKATISTTHKQHQQPQKPLYHLFTATVTDQCATTNTFPNLSSQFSQTRKTKRIRSNVRNLNNTRLFKNQ
ncbi:hypothetical protein CFOL_v3_08865 [Cephalotus follicularis]|uniref:Uncharacterized protein n=1 Tax=Cephalotus follicularis TaxID=3775 RepID=A0A1Q3BBH9_CEPFO|nr:hypothetical protein CFOL_v3_08865 [Cephalotus follicularis]